MKKIILLLTIFASFTYFISCDKESTNKDDNPILIDTTDNDSIDDLEYKIDTVEHFGFDFSAGKKDTTSNWELNMNDGDVIGWHSGRGDNPSYPSYSSYIWYRNSELDEVNYESQIKNYGDVDINSITSISTQWDTLIDPLQPGFVFGAKCRDGYVLFEVVEVVDTVMWRARLKYKFSATNSF